MPDALVNVYQDSPTEPVDGWQDQSKRWVRLNEEVGGNPEFRPLTVKAFYVFGVQLGIFWSVSILLEVDRLPSITYLPAYSLFASGIELLGRCLRGNAKTRGSSEDLKAGFQWLAHPTFAEYGNVPETHKLVETINGPYTIAQLAALRNYTAHGQGAASLDPPPLDFLMLQEMPPLISGAMESYWTQLQHDAVPCNALAKANVAPFRNRPIFDTLWTFSKSNSGQYLAIGDIFGKLDWTYKQPGFGNSPSS
ncbi:MAG: hypothetical protein IIA89_14520 [Chloroflexi bacterium]|nr:hypothetical protein [Chloroflexota bacterium]